MPKTQAPSKKQLKISSWIMKHQTMPIPPSEMPISRRIPMLMPSRIPMPISMPSMHDDTGAVNAIDKDREVGDNYNNHKIEIENEIVDIDEDIIVSVEFSSEAANSIEGKNNAKPIMHTFYEAVLIEYNRLCYWRWLAITLSLWVVDELDE